MVASECAQARRYSPVMNSRDSSREGEHVGHRVGFVPGQRIGAGAAEGIAEVPHLDHGLVLDQAEQVGAGRYQGAADVVLG